nr:hypothetical protein CFP56_45237 [Quercus suber]
MWTMLPKLEAGISTGQALNILVNGQIKLGLMLDSVHGLPEAWASSKAKAPRHRDSFLKLHPAAASFWSWRHRTEVEDPTQPTQPPSSSHKTTQPPSAKPTDQNHRISTPLH